MHAATASAYAGEKVIGSHTAHAGGIATGILPRDINHQSRRDTGISPGTSATVDDSTMSETKKVKLGSVYEQCKKARAADLKVRTILVTDRGGLHAEEMILLERTGNLDFQEDDQVGETFYGSRICKGGKTINQSVSVSFDPANLTCITCGSEHKIIDNRYNNVIALSDQNFVPFIGGDGAGPCMGVVRVEDASLGELIDFFLEIFCDTKLPAGSVVLIGSATHLHRSGTSLYAREWVNCIAKLTNRWPDLRIAPLLPVIREDCPGELARQLGELAAWFLGVYGDSVLCLRSAWNHAITTYNSNSFGSVEYPAPITHRVALPESLSPQSATSVTAFSCMSSSPTILKGVDRKATWELVHVLLDALSTSLHICLLPETHVSRENMSARNEKDTLDRLIVIGASHMKRVVPFLRENGNEVVDLSTPGWIPSPANVAKLLDSVAGTEVGSDTVVVLDLLSNAVYRYAQFDGTLSVPFKSNGKFHMGGGCSPL
jgi:hypothetical protein